MKLHGAQNNIVVITLFNLVDIKFEIELCSNGIFIQVVANPMVSYVTFVKNPDNNTDIFRIGSPLLLPNDRTFVRCLRVVSEVFVLLLIISSFRIPSKQLSKLLL